MPFCSRKCGYCAFYSEPSDDSIRDRYVSALIHELRAAAVSTPIRSLYLGGGTPSMLSLSLWERVLDGLQSLPREEDVEWTVECNPATITREKARLLRSGGVNRISLGVQSLDDALLRALGRVHTGDQARQSFDLLRGVGFDNINLDLMFAIPHQTLSDWEKTLTETLALQAEHISSYEITYEEDTPLFNQLQASQFSASETVSSDMYETMVDTLSSAGYPQYEVSNFARGTPGSTAQPPSFACRHNLNYWLGQPFLGLGPSAWSFVDGARRQNVPNTVQYCDRILAGQSAVASEDHLEPRRRAGEIAAFGLRMIAGWSFDEFRQTTGYDLRQEWPEAMQSLVDCGWGEWTATSFRLTRAGLRFADAAARHFL